MYGFAEIHAARYSLNQASRGLDWLIAGPPKASASSPAPTPALATTPATPATPMGAPWWGEPPPSDDGELAAVQAYGALRRSIVRRDAYCDAEPWAFVLAAAGVYALGRLYLQGRSAKR
jgi:hypothetical protein